jgi:hypothetical protein
LIARGGTHVSSGSVGDTWSLPVSATVGFYVPSEGVKGLAVAMSPQEKLSHLRLVYASLHNEIISQ